MSFTDYLVLPLGYVMKFCYSVIQNYGAAIILFTLLSKVILIPVSVWVHKNSIKMVKIQPAINRIKAKYYGDADTVGEEQMKLYKKEKYNPLASLLPLAIQIILLLGLISVIYHPLTYLCGLDGETVSSLASLTGADLSQRTVQLSIIEALKSPIAISSSTLCIAADAARSLNMSIFGVPLSDVPSLAGGVTLITPLIAGLSSWLLCHIQNRQNVLQAETSRMNRIGTMALSVGISLILGLFVPIGVALYWIFSNLFSIVQQFILNAVINPKKYVDYEELEASREELASIEGLGGGKKSGLFSKDENAKREKADYKRFFNVINKHIVFYSESNGFYKYFEGVIGEILRRTNISIHYITSDPNDDIFELAKKEPKIKPYYIGERRLITLFMKMDADVVVMTMSDLGNYHYKRSYVRSDIEYVYMFHYPLSTHMVLHTGALNHYDTILCVGEFQFAEIRKTEELYGLPEKKLISCGYGQLEKLYDAYRKMPKESRERPKVLIAPSWQTDNILDSCIDGLLSSLLGKGFDVYVRPHPEYVKRYKSRMDAIVERYKDYTGGDLFFELDFTSNSSIFDSDVVISDWSGTAYEFSFVTLKPAVFVDTPPKIHNPEYVKLGIEPLELTLRDEMGIRVSPDKTEGLAERLRALLDEGDSFAEKLLSLRNKYIANFGKSSEVAYGYLISAMKAQSEKKKEKK